MQTVSSSPVSPPVSPQVKPRGPRSTVYWVIIVLLLAVIGVLTWMLLGTDDSSGDNQALTESNAAVSVADDSTNVAASTESNSAVNSDTAYSGWQTYSDATNGFSFRYPAGWTSSTASETYAPTNSVKRVEVSLMPSDNHISFDNGMDLKIFYSSSLSSYPSVSGLIQDQQTTMSQDVFATKSYSAGQFSEGYITTTKSTAADSTYEENAELFMKTNSGFYTAMWTAVDPNSQGYRASDYLVKILNSFSLTK